ncbi:MAG: phospholipase/carboxylesterase [Thermomicrobiales bacterium]|jgi:phospholipase/carboxylesterase|nr:phospholipase/carboxylesterase [Thermomicrobiales bacterium]
MLQYDQHIPRDAKDGAPLIVLLHGRGSHKGDLMGLQPALPRNAIVVTPQAPFPGAPWGYGDGWAWYRFLGGTTPEPESFEASQQALASFLEDLPSKLPVRPGPLVLGGFSQGATTSLAQALRRPGEVDGVLIFSGFLALHPSVSATPETVDGTRYFWGHGTQDPAIPFAHARTGRAALQAAGADLETHDYPIGHWIEPTELRDATNWLDRLFAGSVTASATK